MRDVTLGTISSHPNEKGEHALKCPKCAQTFISKISKDDKTSVLNPIVCPACSYSDVPKHFVAAAHQSKVNNLARGYVSKELKKAFRGHLR
jgi:DNA-directed RNA polymerase subunit RPC12/RpoP